METCGEGELACFVFIVLYESNRGRPLVLQHKRILCDFGFVMLLFVFIVIILSESSRSCVIVL